jgi:hypothetical protein
MNMQTLAGYWLRIINTATTKRKHNGNGRRGKKELQNRAKSILNKLHLSKEGIIVMNLL